MSQTILLNSQIRRQTPQNVFVYGTLKEGYGNHQFHLQAAKKLGVGQLDGIMFHLGAFPAINLSEPLSKIHGEVYQVSWDDIMAMDRLEGTDRGFYDRVEVKIPQYTKAWTYVMSRPSITERRYDYVIPSGNWRGSDTPKVKWCGWGKGFTVGTFETSGDEIRIGDGTSDFVLRRNQFANTYDLINKKTGEIAGAGYKHLGDMVKNDGTTKPILRLVGRNKTIDELVKEEVTKGYYPAPRVTPSLVMPDLPALPAPKPPEGPQAARLLGLGTKEA